ncbi:MAG: polysaccharide pyruvyl transferase family protein [Candidatus Omnitrophica bacterium]|nr:polysaccharide pyruvyl transferase family protein [Candidatus Omnitrophota bacterium]
MGVSALFHSCLHGLAKRLPNMDLTVFDNKHGMRSVYQDIEGTPFAHRCMGGRSSKKIYRSDTLWNIRIATKLGGLWNPGARALLRADAVMDISGGDSFTDIYGQRGFEYSCLRKGLALSNSRPLILLPQTYGPFKDPENYRRAAEICVSARAAWARDERSYEYLREMLGDRFDPAIHRVGVDVAFLLPTVEPDMEADLRDYLEGSEAPIIGLNVSGLLFNRPEVSREQFGLISDYDATIRHLVERFLKKTDARILLVPHVVTKPGHFESDLEACLRVRDDFKKDFPDRIETAPAYGDPREVKGLISRVDWFCGTRMHATIAGLSNGIPTAAISYSPKTLGVFETSGMGDHVADPTRFETEGVAEILHRSFSEREQAAIILRDRMPEVKRQAEEQMDEIAEATAAGRAPLDRKP